MGRVSGRGCVDGAGDGVVPVISANIHSETEEQRCRIDCQEWGGGHSEGKLSHRPRKHSYRLHTQRI